MSVRRHFRFVILRVDHLALAAGFAARNKYFTPTKDTEVEVRASDCAKVVRKVVVADQPVELIADSKWDSSCTSLHFDLLPQLYDPKLYANWIEALFKPKVRVMGDAAANPPIPDHDFDCPYPPFPQGNKPLPLPPYTFQIDKPLDQVLFSGQPQATGGWDFARLYVCPAPQQCNPSVLEPFKLQLTCTPLNPR